jgi:hypothetical protein
MEATIPGLRRKAVYESKLLLKAQCIHINEDKLVSILRLPMSWKAHGLMVGFAVVWRQEAN